MAQGSESVFKLKRGLNLPVGAGPADPVELGGLTSSVAIHGRDYLGLKPRILVKEGDKVRLGDPLVADKVRDGVVLCSPGSGVVRSILLGRKRFLDGVVIDLDNPSATDDLSEPCVSVPALTRKAAVDLSVEDATSFLMQSGLWSALRTRPYGFLADPKNPPAAIFVTAIDTRPLCAQPELVIAQDGQDFSEAWHLGLTILTRLFSGVVHVAVGSQGGGFMVDLDRVRFHTFEGPHPAGLVGTHMHHVHPVGLGVHHWYLDFQSVLSLGRTALSGRIDTRRLVSLGGFGLSESKLLKTRVGGNVLDIVRGRVDALPSALRILSGSLLDGKIIDDRVSCLGRFDAQITVLEDNDTRDILGWVRPYKDRFATLNVHWSAFMRPKRIRMTTNRNGSHRAMVPVGQFEQVMPYDTLPTQLLRALLVGDIDRSVDLGALELEEDDLALCSYVCFAKYEYGVSLRECLTRYLAGE